MPYVPLARPPLDSRAGGRLPDANETPSSRAISMITVLSAMQVALCAVVLVLLRLNRRADASPSEAAERAGVNRQDVLFAKRNRILKLLADDSGCDYGACLKVGDLMSSMVTTIPPTETLAAVRDKMQRLKLRHLLVVNEADQLVGVLSDRDLSKSGGRTAQDVMTAEPMTVTPDMPISPAITTLITKHISSLPVVEAGKLVGVLTRTDLMLSLQCVLQALQRAGASQPPADAPTSAAEAVPA
jgi:CBS domain-containing protein